jgi:hypothetical protein
MEQVIDEEFFYDTEKITAMRDAMEQMNKHNQVAALRILKDSDVTLNENKNGTYINLTDVSNATKRQLELFIEHVNMQEESLEQAETQKNAYKTEFFSLQKDNKETAIKNKK